MAKPWKLRAVRGRDQKFRLQLTGGNGEIVMQGHAPWLVKMFAVKEAAGVMTAKVVYVKPNTAFQPLAGCWTIQAVPRRDGGWFTQLCDDTGTPVMHGEGYTRVDSADRAVRKVCAAEIVYQESGE